MYLAETRKNTGPAFSKTERLVLGRGSPVNYSLSFRSEATKLSTDGVLNFTQ